MKKNTQNDFIEISVQMRQANRILNRRLAQLELEEEKCIQLIQKSTRIDQQKMLKTNLLNYRQQKEKLTNLKVRLNTILVQIEMNKSIKSLEEKINHINNDLNSLGLFKSPESNVEKEIHDFYFNLDWFKRLCMDSMTFGLNELINFIYIQII